MPKRSEQRRAGRWVRQQLRSELVQGWRRNWRMLMVAHAGYFGAAAAFALLLEVIGSPPRANGFAVGLILGATPIFWIMFRDALGLAHRSMGAESERWTASELAKLSRSWTVLHDIELDNLNVDHVIIGPGRLYAVETKWLGSVPNHHRLKQFAGQATNRAQKLEGLLRTHGCEASLKPLLVLWGPGSTNLLRAGGQHLKPSSVIAVAGPDSKHWLRRIEDAATSSNKSQDAIQILQDLIDS